jgi:hypothetical protein
VIHTQPQLSSLSSWPVRKLSALNSGDLRPAKELKARSASA